MKRTLCLCLLVAGCGGRDLVAINYSLTGLDPTQVVRVSTLIDVSADDGRQFYADQPFREVATGVGYEVRDVDGSGRRKILITHDATLGYVFAATFVFTLLPPVGEAPPKLTLSARADDASSTIGTAPAVDATFANNASAALAIVDQRCGSRVCDADEACCQGACVKPLTDNDNCGACNTACGNNEACAGGVCRCNGGSQCTNSVCCSTGCVDLQTDAANCGSCGKGCAPGETCVAGNCGCPSAVGDADCGTEVCCTQGNALGCQLACNCGGVDCTANQICCGTTCVDPSSDNGNCGGCGHACTGGLQCSGGSCTCQGQICSGGDMCCSDGCASLSDDPQHCGGCSNVCSPNEKCASGSCSCGGGPACLSGPGVICCGTSCPNSDTDTTNCGGCNNQCATGESCSGGTCSCNGGAACVGNQTCCSDGCFDLSSSQGHCGGCNIVCDVTQTCQQGMCQGGGCSCSNGNNCKSAGGGTTTCICGGGQPCTGTSWCCGGTCIDLSSDAANCGRCGNMCGNAQMCCSGQCVDHTVMHCNSCTNVCGPGLNGSSRCCPPGMSSDVYTCSTSGLCLSGAMPGGNP